MPLKRLLLIFFLIITAFKPAFPQPGKTTDNLGVLYALADSAAAKMKSEMPGLKEKLIFQANPPSLAVLTGRMGLYFSNHGIRTFSQEAAGSENERRGIVELTVNLDKAEVKYQNMHRGSLFGGLKVEREVFLGGMYSVNGVSREFNLSNTDTVYVEDINEIENRAYPFTSAELPPEPFLSSLIEPAVAIGTAAIAVYLFFSVRSK